MELSGYAVAPLREGDVTRCRGLGNGLMPILPVTAADGSLASSERLEHEYALKRRRAARSTARSSVRIHPAAVRTSCIMIVQICAVARHG
ncbi:MAG: Histidine kinase, dimerization/phosphoacceptor [Candidatus Eremiobacteraeota bacterium]|nr:Histidine kinase, dimerization/phosphoacceptor [Candidatus Eremiobacteraeota bacterium]